jgi:catechol 2,3-dioxygenase-like lactoylglutathione lyase family enzyme
MIVKRIVADIATTDIEAGKIFYRDILGLDVVMDHGWIVTLASVETTSPQISLAVEGGSGAAVPDLSIEVDDLDEALVRVRNAGVAIEYGPTVEPWRVRRFFVRDPAGRLINILEHQGS